MPRRLMPRLSAVALGFIVLVAADPASAAWRVSGAGPTRAQAVIVPAGATPTAIKAFPPPSYSPVYTLTWTTAKLSSGQGVIGYQVRRTINPRNAGISTEPISGGSCAGTTVNGVANVYVPANPNAATQSCTDTTAYVTGEVTFSVTPVMGRWIGTTSPASPIYI